jgi:TatD DNase family protein
LETDAPDMPPSWLRQQRNQSAELPRIAESLASLRNIDKELLQEALWQNACRLFHFDETSRRHDAGAQPDLS